MENKFKVASINNQDEVILVQSSIEDEDDIHQSINANKTVDNTLVHKNPDAIKTKEKIADKYTSSSCTVRSVPKPLKNSKSPLSQSSSSTTSKKVIQGGRAPRIQLATNPKEFIKLRATCKYTKKKALINQ